MPPYSPEELRAMEEADAEIEDGFELTADDLRLSRELDAEAKLSEPTKPDPNGGQKEYLALWRRNNRKHILEYNREYRERNHEKVLESQRKSYHKHREKRIAEQRERYRENREYRIAWQKAYNRAHKGELKAKRPAKKEQERSGREPDAE